MDELSKYSYTLPKEFIANKPCNPRDHCKLLILDDKIVHERFDKIIDWLMPEDVLVLNNTKVSHSKLIGQKDSGSPAEVILLKKLSDKTYEIKIKTKNPIIGTKVLFKNEYGTIIKRKSIDIFVMEFNNTKIFDNAILPTPPYIERKITDSEYQTVFSKVTGSLAAPTAGLHFTKRLLNQIKKKEVKIVYVTLHVSYGTFKNIEDINTYIMDPEWYEISKESADNINNRTGRLIVCGTTTLKTLETSSKSGKIISGTGESRLFIKPGYKFQSGTDILITNFHLPKSTLLLLTCAFGERKRILEAYTDAITNNYRFYSLGDAMMIYASNKPPIDAKIYK